MAEKIKFQMADEPEEVMRIDADGRLFWRDREVETDDELRQMIRDLHGWFLEFDFTRLREEGK